MLDESTAGKRSRIVFRKFNGAYRILGPGGLSVDLPRRSGANAGELARQVVDLFGPYPQAQERYRERSPLYHVDQLSKTYHLFSGFRGRHRAIQSG
jgi:hypothetical protein